jgi:hypothetical protein
MNEHPENWLGVEKVNPIISMLVFDPECENCMTHYEKYMEFMQTIPPSSACFVVLKIEDVFEDLEQKYRIKDQVPVYLFIENGREKTRIVNGDFEAEIRPLLLESIQKSQ